MEQVRRGRGACVGFLVMDSLVREESGARTVIPPRLRPEGKPGSPPTDRGRDKSGSGDRESGKILGLLRGGGVHKTEEF